MDINVPFLTSATSLQENDSVDIISTLHQLTYKSSMYLLHNICLQFSIRLQLMAKHLVLGPK